MDGFGTHTFSFMNNKNERYWVKFHYLTKQGIKNYDNMQADLMSAQDPDMVNNDLFQSIAKGDYPKWKFCIQIMPEAQGYTYPGAFDVTKIWSHKDFPLIEVGELELNRNVTNYFAEVEQAAFSPGNFVPGIGASPDKVLQGRLISYEDAERYRIGTNFDQLPINKCCRAEPHHYYKDGAMNLEIKEKFPTWQPNSFGGPMPNPLLKDPPQKAVGDVDRFSQKLSDEDLDYYKQPGDLFRLLSEDEQIRLADALAKDLEVVPEYITKKMICQFSRADPRYGELVEKNLRARKAKQFPRTEHELLQEKLSSVMEKKEKNAYLESKMTSDLKKLDVVNVPHPRTKPEVSL